MRSTLPSAPLALAAHVCRYFEDELAPHFATEESELMVAVDGLDRELDATCADLRRDHDRMRSLIADLACMTDGADITELLERFGTLLEAHVRAEERTFFARVQEVVDPGALSALAPRLVRHAVGEKSEAEKAC